MIKRELVIFLVVGVTTVLVDYFSYRGLIAFEIISVDFAKAVSFLIGTLFAYYANRFWTFGNQQYVQGTVWRFIILYTGTLGVNVLTNALALKVFFDVTYSIEMAFVLATSLSAGLNFLGMKFFVFRAPVSLEKI